MSWEWPLDISFLGAGGKDPRLDALMGSGETRRLLELPPSHSAYAIDIEYEDGTLAVGTKGGLVYIVTGNGNQKTGEQIPRKLAQGAPVLSVCWASKSVLVVSDTAGRVLLWDTNQEEPLRPLDTGGETICSLVNLADGLLAGLSSKGKLLFWHLWEGRLVQTTDVPLPPPTSALVRMVYWPAEHALVCPGWSGNLTLVDPEKNEIRELNAHKGALYAISVWGEGLLTVGMEDARLKFWEAGSDKPVLDSQVIEGVISAAALSNQPAKVLLVEARGIAKAYTLEEDKPRLIGQLLGEDYRAVIAPVPERMQALYAKRQEEEVRQIVREIQEGMGRVPDDVIDRLHSRATDLGYEHVSLALRAEQADKKGNLVEGLRFCHMLMQILPRDNPSILASMESYAALLEKAWHIPEADDVCRSILGIDPNYRFRVEAYKLADIARKVRGGNWVVEPDIPIELVIESSTVIQKRVVGRYVMKSLRPESCGRARLSPEMIVEKYERVRNESLGVRLPAATAEQVWWVSRKGYDEVQLVTFGDGATNGIKGLQFALQVSCGELDTVVNPVVLFDWRGVLPYEFIEEGNERASRVLGCIGNKALSNSYIAAVHGALKQALRRLVTENRPQRGIRR